MTHTRTITSGCHEYTSLLDMKAWRLPLSYVLDPCTLMQTPKFSIVDRTTHLIYHKLSTHEKSKPCSSKERLQSYWFSFFKDLDFLWLALHVNMDWNTISLTLHKSNCMRKSKQFFNECLWNINKRVKKKPRGQQKKCKATNLTRILEKTYCYICPTHWSFGAFCWVVNRKALTRCPE